MSVEAMLAVQKLAVSISHAGFRVLMTLAEHADPQGANTWPSIDTIAREAQTDGKTVRRCLAKLQADGLIAGERGRGRGNTTLWRMLFPVMPLGKAAAKPGVEATPAPVKEGMTPSIDPVKEGMTPSFVPNGQAVEPRFDPVKEGLMPIKEGMTPPEPVLNQKEESSSLRSLCVSVQARGDFEVWWAAYPRRVGKDAARKAYAAAVKRGAPPLVLLEAVRRQRWNPDPRYQPNPATWLNGGRWQDDPDAAAPPQLVGSQHPRRETYEEGRRRKLGITSIFDLDGMPTLDREASHGRIFQH